MPKKISTGDELRSGDPRLRIVPPSVEKTKYVVFHVRDDKLEVSTSEEKIKAGPFPGAVTLKRINDYLGDIKEYRLLASQESLALLSSLTQAGLNILTIQHAAAIYYANRDNTSEKAWLVLAMGMKRTVCSLVVEGIVRKEVPDEELSFSGLCRSYVEQIASWVNLQTTKYPRFKQDLLAAMVSVSQSGKDQMVGTVPVSKPVTLNASLDSFKALFSKVDPNNEARSLILSDWAATHNDLKVLLEEAYRVVAPKPEEAFNQARRGLVIYEQAIREAKEQICTNPNCALELRANSETFCNICGGELSKSNLSAWIAKYVVPATSSDANLSDFSTSKLLENAALMGVDSAEAAINLTRFLELKRSQKSSSSTNEEKVQPSRKIRSIKRPTKTALPDTPAPPSEPTNVDVTPAVAKRAKPDRRLHAVILLVFVLLGVIAYWSSPSKTVEKATADAAPSPTHPEHQPSPSSSAPPPISHAGMVQVSGGQFLMGNDNTGDMHQKPAHEERVDPFFMDETEVTRAAYKRCVDDQLKCGVPFGWNGNTYPAGTNLYPVTGVSWHDAQKYCEWAGNKRLPTEAEWEFAARAGGVRSNYPWGETWQADRANLMSPTLKPVRSYEAESSIGLFDMIGNAWEWTASKALVYGTTGRYLQPPTPMNVENLRIIRGGCHLSPNPITATYRGALLITKEKDSYEQTGFRCVLPVSQR